MTGLQKIKGNNPNLFTVPSDQDFLKILAQYLLKNTTPFGLAKHTIFLPTQRACKKLETELLNHAKAQAVLLPRMVPLGQVEEDELTLTSLEGSEFGFNLPPIITNEKRQIILAKIISGFYKNQNTPVATSKASYLATQLAQLIDQIEMEGLTLDNLENLVPQNFATHWQTTLDFLNIIKDFWPKILSAEKAIEFKKYHRLLIEKLIQEWGKNPPKDPIIVAGSTGSIPSTASLINVIYGLDNGMIILPGLDTFLSSKPEASHPQNTMQSLLEKLGVSTEQVKIFPGCTESHRHKFLNSVFNDQAININENPLFQYIECDHEQEEASVIAASIRSHLEDPKKMIQVITPDRNLAERVINELSKWNIKTNDSGGKPLRRTPLGSFILLIATWLKPQLKTVDFLATLKHPYAQKYKFLAHALERFYFRAVSAPILPYQLDENIDAVLEKTPPKFHHDLRDFLAELSYVKNKIMTLNKDATLSDFLRIHQVLMEWLADDTYDSFENIGHSSESIAFNQLWQNLSKEGTEFVLSDSDDYGPFLESFLLQIKIRPHKSLHPRIHILGLIESRLMRSDVVILAGLNEGTWPPEPSSDPWFNQAMRKQFGLPSHERRIGLSCLDFIHACGNKEVIMTRSQRVNGTPAIPSRFLLKLESGLKKSNFHLNKDHQILSYVRHFTNTVKSKAISAPVPAPELKARPRKLSVTEVEVLLKDPYSIYAKHILKLKPLNDLDIEADAKEFGILIHKIFQLHINKQTFNLDSLFLKVFQNSPHKKIWWIRIQRAYDWFLSQVKDCDFSHIHTEVFGNLTFQSLGGSFTLTGIADRIDCQKNSVEIIDYKTGAIPLAKNIKNGRSSQLPMEGIILKEGGFKDIGKLALSNLVFWHVTGKQNKGSLYPIKDDLENLLKNTEKGLKNLVHQFDQQETPYMSHPHGIEGYGSYNHLSRIKEWLN